MRFAGKKILKCVPAILLPVLALAPVSLAQGKPADELAVTCGQCRAQIQDNALESGLELGDRCAELAQQSNDKRWLAWAHYECLGQGYYRSDELGQAIAHYEQALDLYEELGDTAQLAETLSTTGALLERIGDLTQALEYQLRARSLFESLGDIKGKGLSLLRAGVVHSALGDLERALEYAQQALEAYRAADWESGQASALNNIAGIYLKTGQPQKALLDLEESLAIKRRLGDEKGVARRLSNIASVYLELGQLDEAFDVAQQANEKSRDWGTPG